MFNTKNKGLALAALGAVLFSASFMLNADHSLAASQEKAVVTAKVTKPPKTAKPAKVAKTSKTAPTTPVFRVTAVDKATLSPWEAALQQRLSALAQHDLFQRSQLGMVVYDLTIEKVLFEHQPKQLLRPASTMKSLVALTALDTLGPLYQLHTKLAYDGTIKDGVLTGNIYCIGGFDPLFDSQDMQAFVRSIKSLGIHTIKGSLIADVSMMEGPRWGIGWCWDDDEYNPPLFPLLVNGKDRFMQVFQSKLRAAGITPPVLVVRGQVPSTALPLCSRSHSMQEVLQPMLKDSDNLCAEAMFYQLAAFKRSNHATAEDARLVVNDFIRKLGLNSDIYNIADGCGLSLYDYLSPELELALLKYAYKHKEIYHVFFPALAVGGVDGTLDYRMQHKSIKGAVHAKTGTLTGVSALAGYTTAPNGHLLAFSIMNNGVLDTPEVQSWQDEVCLALHTTK
ncbi:MAG: D-alanyl-D-alanine carboxypeptidase/D-alanyl-D-alanine-endopeptidase [Phascolarctobacterium sp.]